MSKRHSIVILAVVLFVGLGRARAQDNNVPDPWLQAIGAVPTLVDSPLVVDLRGLAGYDSNVFNDNRSHSVAPLFEPGVHAAWLQESSMEREHAILSYDGQALVYPGRQYADHAYQAAALDFDDRLTPRWDLHMRGGGFYQTGVFFFSSAAQPVSVVSTPENPSVITPNAHEWSDQARVDLSYRLGPLGSLGVFARYSRRRYSHITDAAALYNSSTYELGGSYVRRVSRSWWIGPTVSAQRLSFGSVAMANLFTMDWSASWHASPIWTFTGFVGGQHLSMQQQLAEQSNGAVVSVGLLQSHWHSQFGGSVQREWSWIRAAISAQRAVTDGGGLLTTVVNTYEQVLLTIPTTPDAMLAWKLSLIASHGQSSSLAPGLSQGILRDDRVRVMAQRWLSDRWSIRLVDEFGRQRAIGLPRYSNATRNIFSVGVAFRLFGPPGEL